MTEVDVKEQNGGAAGDSNKIGEASELEQKICKQIEVFFVYLCLLLVVFKENKEISFKVFTCVN